MQFIPPDESVRYDRAYTHDEIEQLLNTADKRLKVIVLLMANGLREGALPDLRIQDLEKTDLPQPNVKRPQQVYKVWVYARSKKSKYYTFVTPETTAAIDDYLEFRSKVGGETVQKASPLIREQFDVEGKSTKTRSNINNPRRLSIPGLSKLIERALLSAGIDPNHEVLRCGGFRKFAITQMKHARIDFSDREYLVGHKYSRGLDNNYDRTTEEERLFEWSKAIDNLTINQAHRLKKKLRLIEGETNQRIAAQDREITMLKNRLQAEEAQRQKILDDMADIKRVVHGTINHAEAEDDPIWMNELDDNVQYIGSKVEVGPAYRDANTLRAQRSKKKTR